MELNTRVLAQILLEAAKTKNVNELADSSLKRIAKNKEDPRNRKAITELKKRAKLNNNGVDKQKSQEKNKKSESNLEKKTGSITLKIFERRSRWLRTRCENQIDKLPNSIDGKIKESELKIELYNKLLTLIKRTKLRKENKEKEIRSIIKAITIYRRKITFYKNQKKKKALPNKKPSSKTNTSKSKIQKPKTIENKSSKETFSSYYSDFMSRVADAQDKAQRLLRVNPVKAVDTTISFYRSELSRLSMVEDCDSKDQLVRQLQKGIKDLEEQKAASMNE